MQSNLSMMSHLVRRYSRIVCIACLVLLGLASVAAAQQPTATIVQMDGEVLVSLGDGSAAPGSLGLALFQGDAIQTKAGALAVLELSDGSQLELGENTNLLMEQLAIEPYSEARVSRVKLWWGKMRAVLSPGHQQEGASFDIQTPNSLVGVKFSKPDIEVQYDRNNNKTYAYSPTVDLTVLDLVSGASRIVAAGTGVTVSGSGIQLLLQGVFPPQSPVVPPSQPVVPPSAGSAGSAGNAGSGGLLSGNTGTIVAVGLGAGAVAGGIVALNAAQESSQPSEATDFSGTFHANDSLEPGVDRTVALQLSQNDRAISGTRTETVVVSGCCTAVGSGNVNGTVQGNTAVLNVVREAGSCYCTGTDIIGIYWDQELGSGTASLDQNGSILQYNGQAYIRQ